MNPTLTINLTVEEINLLLLALAKLPFENVADLIMNIKQQAQAQLEPPAPPADAE